jgi:hypothetical protein
MASNISFMAAEIGTILLVLAVLLLASTFVHEAGHLLGGLLLGFGIESVRVGPIELRRQRGWAWAFSKADLAGGIVKAQFRTLPGPQAAWRCAGFLIAGPLANLLVALTLAPLSSSPTLAGAFGGWLAIASLFVGIVNLIPLRTRTGRSDGAKLFWLIFSRNRREQLIFAFSLKARINEIVALSRGKNFKQAIEKIDELSTRFLRLPNVGPEAIRNLSKLRDSLEKTLAESGTANAETQAVEG